MKFEFFCVESEWILPANRLINSLEFFNFPVLYFMAQTLNEVSLLIELYSFPSISKVYYGSRIV